MDETSSQAVLAAQAPETAPFAVVGIGASAGGLKAVSILLDQLPADTGMAYVVILHLSPRHESNADKLLQRMTRMPVTQVTEQVRLEPNHVYVISPTLELALEDGVLVPRPAVRPRGRHVSIDRFLRTLAEARQDRAMAVVLSGTGSDGSLGVAAVKQGGGVTLAQSPDDAEYDDMPRHAIASGHVDFVLPVADIPQKLIELWANATSIRLPLPGELHAVAGANSEHRALNDILQLLAERTGHDFKHYKPATVLRRIERRMQVTLVNDLHSYRHYLMDHQAEAPALLDDMLINVTGFFRDREAFEALEREVVPGLFIDREPGAPIRAWVPGCSTGEEAYSLAMLLTEESARQQTPVPFQVFATDIDDQAIQRARAGIYPHAIQTDVPPARLREFFAKEPSHYRIQKSLREHVLFAPHNVLRDPPFSRLDLVSCRNLLIYLDRDIQARLLQMFQYSLRRGGLLFLGGSESVEAAAQYFEPLDKKNRIFRARAQPRTTRSVPSLPLRATPPMPRPPMPARPASGMGPGFSYAEVHQRVLDHYAPPSVVVDESYTILHMSERVGRFLRFAPGEPTLNLLDVVHPELRRELRTALFHALRIRKSVEVRKALRDEDGEGQEPVLVNMVVRPFRDHDAGADLVLVLFDAVDDTLGDAARPTDAGQEGVLGQLELELQRTRARLQATIEEAEISTEELKASNEELQAINEELRSATEELETSKEELQSLNEELITVNFELKAKVDEASRANDDLQNLIASTDIATIFIDAELRIKRYTPRAEDLFSLIPADIGRHLADISHRLDYPELSSDAVAAFESLQSRERAVMSAAGREYIARVLPYRTTENRIDGAVLTFIDVTDLRHAERRGSQAAEAGAGADPHAADLVRDEFLAVMSHELKHPLNLMSVNVDRLSRAPEVRGAEATARVVEQLRRAVQGQRKIIDDLLDLSRLRTGKLSLNMAAVDLGALVHDIVAIARADASCARIDLQEAIEDGAMVMADPQRMEQVVWNLVGNAIKFTGEGRVTVRVETRDGEVRLSVQDDGPGIAAEFLPRVFDLFGQAAARAASRQTGLGIGLALSRQLVHSQGGRIQALSAGPGKGSTFTVWLPQVRELPRTVVPLDDSIPQAALSGWRILVVDDMADTVDALASLLALEGAMVTTAGGGAEALALAAERDLDLLLSDTGMPGMDGNELVRRIRALPRHQQLPAIAISGFNSPRDVAKARAAGFNDHIGKPITFAGLIGAIRRLAHAAD